VSTEQDLGREHDGTEADRRLTYVGVLALEAFVVAVLWAIGRYFGHL
jgi:hypothetical protein